MAVIAILARKLDEAVRAVLKHLGYVERWLLISIVAAVVSSLAIGLFYVLLRLVLAGAAYIHGVAGPEIVMKISDYSIVALLARHKPLIPVILGVGALAASLIVYKFEPEAAGGGTDAAVYAYHHRAGIMRPRVAIVKAVASAILLGTGGSAGPEGPSIQIGGAAGSSIAKYLGMGVVERKIMLVAGMAAALSFIFQSPVGSAIFAVEVLYMRDMELNALIPALFASIISYSLSLHILGPGYKLPSLAIDSLSRMYSLDVLASYILLGLFTAPFAYMYVYVFTRTRRVFEKLHREHRIPQWIGPVIGALLVGVIGAFVPHVLGTGEELLSLMLEGFQQGEMPGLVRLFGDSLLLTALLLAILKIVVTSLTVGSGGSGGLLAPGLFAGAMIGEVFGLIVHDYTGIPPGVYAYLGMASLFGAASKVSVGLSFFVAEIGGTPALVVPALISSLTASLALGNVSIVESQLPHKVPPAIFTVESLLEILRGQKTCIKVREFPIRHITAANWNEKLRDVVKRMIRQKLRIMPVVDDYGRIVGVLDPGYIGLDLRYALRSEELVAEVSLTQPPIVYIDDCIVRALEEMVIYGADYVGCCRPRLQVCRRDTTRRHYRCALSINTRGSA
ncbi:conserved archaeal protein [Hyperthermus butylicus DSM 5456]|uniref:Conserved archaeal protein n=2 Tax=Hyperthermus butylicus TaxID=54248 RepID=A2BL36_HYPBU|nr:conserved archaeal protein [Hyperthermus butylicus DSM 5456]